MTYLPFQEFDPLAPVRIYWRALPHWRQEGATYFVTFRLADSIPFPTAAQWRAEKESWFRSHGIAEHFTVERQRQLYLAVPLAERRAFEREQSRKLLFELDRCHGRCEFRDASVRRIVAQALLFFDPDRVQSGDFVIMPNHGHWLVMPKAGFELEDVLQSIRKYSARRINQLTCRTGKLWQKESFDHIVRDHEKLNRTRDYIRDNPSAAGLRPDEYTYYRAEWL